MTRELDPPAADVRRQMLLWRADGWSYQKIRDEAGRSRKREALRRSPRQEGMAVARLEPISEERAEQIVADLTAALASEDMAERRRLVRSLVSQVTLAPGRGP